MGALWLLLAGGLCQLIAATSSVPQLSYTLIDEYPRNKTLYMEGFLYLGDCKIMDSNGLYYVSSLHITDLKSGTPLVAINLDPSDFSEGIQTFGPYVYQLTYIKKIVYVYDKNTLEKKFTLNLPAGIADGWGMTTDGTNLIISDGTDYIHFVQPNPANFTRLYSVLVRKDRWSTISNINELEYIEGYVWANEYTTDNIWIIDPVNGTAVGLVISTPLKNYLTTANFEVTNGIAYTHDKWSDILLTGKKWDKIFRVRMDNLPRRIRPTPLLYPSDTCFNDIAMDKTTTPAPQVFATAVPQYNTGTFGGLGRATGISTGLSFPTLPPILPPTTPLPTTKPPTKRAATTTKPPTKKTATTKPPTTRPPTTPPPTTAPRSPPTPATQPVSVAIPPSPSPQILPVTILFPPPQPGTCLKSDGSMACGGIGAPESATQSPSNQCWCDFNCVNAKDCCSDFVTVCLTPIVPPRVAARQPGPDVPANAPDTCVGTGASLCGGSGQYGTCWCDLSCILNEDCCSDFTSACMAPAPPRPPTTAPPTTPPPTPAPSVAAPVITNTPKSLPVTSPSGYPTVLNVPIGSPSSLLPSSSTTSSIPPGLYAQVQVPIGGVASISPYPQTTSVTLGSLPSSVTLGSLPSTSSSTTYYSPLTTTSGAISTLPSFSSLPQYSSIPSFSSSFPSSSTSFPISSSFPTLNSYSTGSTISASPYITPSYPYSTSVTPVLSTTTIGSAFPASTPTIYGGAPISFPATFANPYGQSSLANPYAQPSLANPPSPTLANPFGWMPTYGH